MTTFNATIKRDLSHLRFEEPVVELQMFDNMRAIPKALLDLLNSYRSVPADVTSTSAQVRETMSAYSNIADLATGNMQDLKTLLAQMTSEPQDAFSMKSIMRNITTHPVGILSSTTNLLRASDATTFMASFTSLFSLIGLEAGLIEKAKAQWSPIDISGPNVATYQANSSMIKLCCMLVSILGEGTDVVGTVMKGLRNSQKDHDSVKRLIEEIEDMAEDLGMGFSTRTKVIRELKTQIEGLMVSLHEFDSIMAISPARFCRSDSYNKFLEVGKTLHKFKTEIATIKMKDFVGTSMNAEIQLLDARYQKMKTIITKVRGCNAERVKPTGICLKGESQIGKSHLMTKIEKDIRNGLYAKFVADPENETLQAFADADQWTTWSQNMRDKYDQNYNGQQGHSIDDAFSSRECLEHQAIINWISNRPVPTYQAEMQSKGDPYECKYLLASCNNFPHQSTTINNIDALCQRFPIFVHVCIKPDLDTPQFRADLKNRDQIDWEFNHLQFHLSSGMDQYNNAGPVCLPGGCRNGRTVSYQELMETILNNLVMNQSRFDSIQAQTEARFQGKRDDQYYDSNQEDCKGYVSGCEAAMTYLTSENPTIYKTIADLPQTIQIAMRTARTTDERFIVPEAFRAVHGDRLVDYMNFCSCDLPAVFYAAKHYVPLNRFKDEWNLFFARPCVIGTDANYVWINNDIYFNDYRSLEDLNQLPQDYPPETYGQWLLRNFPFLEQLFNIFGEWSGSIWSILLYSILCVVGMSSFAAWGIVSSIRAFCLSNSIGQFILILACFGLMYILYRLVYFIVMKSLHLITEATWMLFPGMKSLFYSAAAEEGVEYESENSSHYVHEPLKLTRRVTVIGCNPDGTSIVPYDWFKGLTKADGTPVTCTPGKIWRMQVEETALIGAVVTDAEGVVQQKYVRSCMEAIADLIKNKFSKTTSINLDAITPSPEAIQQTVRTIEEVLLPVVSFKLMLGDVEYEKGYDQSIQRSKKTWRPLTLEKGASGSGGSKPRDRRSRRPARPTNFENGIDGNWRTCEPEEGRKLREVGKAKRHHGWVKDDSSDSEDEAVLEKGASGSGGSKPRDRRSRRPARPTQFEKRLVVLEKFKFPQLSDPDSDFDMKEYYPSEQEAYLTLDDKDRLEEDDIIEISSMENPTLLNAIYQSAISFLPDGPTYQAAVDSAALDMMRKCVNTILCKVTTEYGSLGGWGYDTFVYAPSHIVERVGETAICTRKVRNQESKHNYRMICVAYKKEWELCLFKILPINHSSYKGDIDRPINDLVFTKDLMKYVPLSCDVAGISKIKTVIQYLPVSDLICSGKAEYVENYVVKTVNGECINTNIYAITTMRTLGTHTQDGDCGGFVVMLDPYSTKKLIGMHFAAQTRCGAAMSIVCTKERFMKLLSESKLYEETSSVKFQSLPTFPKINMAVQHELDSFDQYVNDGLGIHMPDNKNESDPAFVYLGDLAFMEPPCDIKGKTDHKPSVFHGVFPVTKIPSALIESQVKDTSQLALDGNGRPNILKTQLNANGDGKHMMDQKILDIMLPQLIDHFKGVLNGESIGTSQNFKTALWESVNGQFFNPNYEKINFKSSAGIPWKQMGAPVKSSFFEDVMIPNPLNKTEYVEGKAFLKDERSLFLRKVIKHKLEEAKNLRRTFSMWKCCLKDEVRAIKKVTTGMTRCFQSPPIELVLFGRMLLGRFKAQYKANRNRLFHAIGINPMSPDWTDLAHRLLKHPNYIDVDYKNFDQRLLVQAMEMAAVIVVETIFATEKNREMANARYVYFDEVIRAFCVANRTVFQTEHGNKSGNIFTTEFNNIVNTIYSWYVFIKVTGNTSLQYYLENVEEANFGDDKILAISDLVIDLFNFFSYKKVLEELGQVITPGDKSEEIRSHSKNLSDMIFLKRHFVKFGSIWICPLDKDSIEGVFNYSSLEDDEVEEWFSTILEQLVEASLWGKKYFLQFQKTLLKFALQKTFYEQNRVLCSRIYPALRAEFRQIFCIALDRFGVLDSNISQILRNNLSDNKKALIHYERVELKREIRDSVSIKQEENKAIYQSKTEPNNLSQRNSSQNSFILTMNTQTPNKMNVSKASRTLTLNGGLNSANDIAPEGPIQPQNVQSDIGPPKLMSTADGMVWVYSLQQSEEPVNSGYQIPKLIEKAMSLPKEIQHFQLRDQFTLGDGATFEKLSPTLQEAAPKAYNLMRVFDYMRPKTTILRLDCRPPMGYAQIIKVVSTAVESSDTSVMNRQGVTYDLADNPTMYFEVPYASRDFLKTRDERFFAVLVGNISDPVNSSTNPTPIYIKPSYMVNEMDYFVHRTVLPCPTVFGTGNRLDGGGTITASAVFGSTPVVTGTLGVTASVSTMTFSQVGSYLIAVNFVGTGLPAILTYTQTNGTIVTNEETVNAPGGTGTEIVGYVVFSANTVGATLTIPTIGTTVTLTEVRVAPYDAALALRTPRPAVEMVNEIPGPRRNYGDGEAVYQMDKPRDDDPYGPDKVPSAPPRSPVRGPARYQSDIPEYDPEHPEIDYPDCVPLSMCTPSWLERAKTAIGMAKSVDYVSILKEESDISHKECVYLVKRAGGEDHKPIYQCFLTYGCDRVEEYATSKKEAKQLAAHRMLMILPGVKYQADKPVDNFDTAAAEPTVATDTRPPVGVSTSRASSAAIGKTIGTTHADVNIVQHNFVPYNTYSVTDASAPVFAIRIHPGNWTAGGAQSTAQNNARIHTFSGPSVVGGRPTYATYKITTAANFRQNARFIIAQVPLSYTAAEVAALPATDLKQFPNEEHKLHGTETIFEPQWINRLPALTNHLVDAENTNGWLVCQILENSLAATESSAKLTLWVCANNVTYSYPRVPADIPAPST